MARRHRRTGFLRPELELEHLHAARDMLVRARTEYPINGEAYERAGKAMDAIDDLAETLVGDRSFFWTRT